MVSALLYSRLDWNLPTLYNPRSLGADKQRTAAAYRTRQDKQEKDRDDSSPTQNVFPPRVGLRSSSALVDDQ